MRCVFGTLSVAAMLALGVNLVAQPKPVPSFAPQAKPSFAGEWKMMVARGQGEPGVDLIIAQDATSLTVEYVRGPAPAPAKLTYKLDGSTSRSVLAGRGGAPTEHVSKAAWAGNSIVVTTTTDAGDETRTFSMDSGYLVLETSARARNGARPTATKVIYQPYVQGFGG
jgi:hypothetical protein